MSLKLYKILSIFTLIIISILTIFSASRYQGSLTIYLLFTIASTLLFLNGFHRKAVYFETFIGIFFWLGYWLKFSIRASFFNLQFAEPIGFYNGNIHQMDNALIISTIGISGFLSAFFFNKHLQLISYDKKSLYELSSLEEFYQKNRLKLLLTFFLFSSVIAFTNFDLGIYQKGLSPNTILPHGLNKLFTWLILFGLSSIASFFVYFDSRSNRKGFLSVFLYLTDCFLSNVSLLSRGFILNASSILAVLFFKEPKGKNLLRSAISKISFAIVFLSLFISSVFLVNYARIHKFDVENSPDQASFAFVETTKVLFIDRWVGIEGAIAVSSYGKRGWDLWNLAWAEKFKDNGTSFYDLNLINSHYKHLDLKKHHFISLPGLIAFFYYPNSFLFLFTSCFLLAFLALGIEFLAYNFSGGNIFFSSLIAQVIAYRYAHFGYAPSQSYLIFCTILFNIFLFCFFNKIISIGKYFYLKKKSLNT